jgi:predicted transport protein
MDYAKYFNYNQPGLKLSPQQNIFGNGGISIGFDLNEIINMFRFKQNRNSQFLQNRIIRQEQEKYINYRFTKRFVQKLTKLDGPRLDVFMEYCKPSYPTLALLNDLELGYFIQQKLVQFRLGR